MYTNGLKDRYGSPLLSLRDINNKFKGEVVFGDGQNTVTISSGSISSTGQILKNNSDSLENTSLLNRFESDSRYSQLNANNTLTETNTFTKTVIVNDGVNVTGDVFVSNGSLTFEDLIDGTVVERSGASGYQYVQGIPVNFENGVCYDIGTISDTTNLSNIKFTGEGRLVQTCELWFTTPATPPTAHQWPTNIYWIDSATGAAPTLIASKNYRIVFRQEPNKIIASIAYLY